MSMSRLLMLVAAKWRDLTNLGKGEEAEEVAEEQEEQEEDTDTVLTTTVTIPTTPSLTQARRKSKEQVAGAGVVQERDLTEANSLPPSPQEQIEASSHSTRPEASLKKKKSLQKSSTFLVAQPKEQRTKLGWEMVKQFRSEKAFQDSEIAKDIR